VDGRKQIRLSPATDLSLLAALERVFAFRLVGLGEGDSKEISAWADLIACRWVDLQEISSVLKALRRLAAACEDQAGPEWGNAEDDWKDSQEVGEVRARQLRKTMDALALLQQSVTGAVSFH
jgi:hypothetical protein